MGLVLIAIAEMIGAKRGLGFLIWSAWETFSVEQMYVGLFMIAIIDFGLTIIMNELESFSPIGKRPEAAINFWMSVQHHQF